jgi:hypothetical protein
MALFYYSKLMHTIIKIIGILKQLKIPTIAPTCFGSQRNHHQDVGAIVGILIVLIFL